MKALYKKILALFLGFSNLAVLGLVYQAYMGSGQSLYLFSSNERSDEIEEKIKETCGSLFNELRDKARSSFTCPITINRRHDNSSYKLRMTFLVQHNVDANSGEIVGDTPYIFTLQSRRMVQRKGHATEADFSTCTECGESGEGITVSNIQQLMQEITEEAGEIYAAAEQDVEEARTEHNQKTRAQRQAAARESRCEGRWDKDNEEFEPFDIEERLECKMGRISRLGTPLEVERFYHNNLKGDLWKLAVSDDDYYVREFLDENDFSDPYRYSLSVRSSVGLLNSYAHDWKDRFVGFNPTERQEFARRLNREISRVSEMTQGSYNHNTERFYLNQALDGALGGLNHAEQRLPTMPSPAGGESINWNSVRDLGPF